MFYTFLKSSEGVPYGPAIRAFFHFTVFLAIFTTFLRIWHLFRIYRKIRRISTPQYTTKSRGTSQDRSWDIQISRWKHIHRANSPYTKECFVIVSMQIRVKWLVQINIMRRVETFHFFALFIVTMAFCAYFCNFRGYLLNFRYYFCHFCSSCSINRTNQNERVQKCIAKEVFNSLLPNNDYICYAILLSDISSDFKSCRALLKISMLFLQTGCF